MVHPYLRRRNNEEKVVYPSKKLEEILHRTLGVPLFQEQAMKIAIVAAGFTPAEADQLRRCMATFKNKGAISMFHHKMVTGMVERGYEKIFAEQVFKQLEGFGSYSFPESHAASFALLVYVSSWIKCYHPDIFTTAILNILPMGFYQPAQLVSDAQRHGVEVRPVDVNLSQWDNSLELSDGRYHAIRLGFRQISGIQESAISKLVQERKTAWRSMTQLHDAGVSRAMLEKLADADALRSMNMDRRTALCEVTALDDRPVGIFEGQPSESTYEPDPSLPEMSQGQHVIMDYTTLSLSLKVHPVSFLRNWLKFMNIVTTRELAGFMTGVYVKITGLVLVKQRPETANGFCFITIEDETGTANLIVFGNKFSQYRKQIMTARLLMVEGFAQNEKGIIHVKVHRSHDFSGMLDVLTHSGQPEQGKIFGDTGTVQLSIFPDVRNFK